MSALHIYDHSIWLDLSESQPMGAYLDKNRVRFITGAKVSKFFKSIAKHIYPDITSKELSQYSAHIIRVSAACLLQFADKPANFIKSRLHWEGDSYRTYLRNTPALENKHLQAHSQATAYSLAAANLIKSSHQPVLIVSEDEMGPYADC